MPVTDEYLQYSREMEEELRGLHDYFFTNIEYVRTKKKKTRIEGEIDMLGYDDDTNTLTVYEFKSSRKKSLRSKGRSQLSRAKNYFNGCGISIDGDPKYIENIVMVLDMYGPNESGTHGTERTKITEKMGQPKTYKKRKRRHKKRKNI